MRRWFQIVSISRRGEKGGALFDWQRERNEIDSLALSLSLSLSLLRQRLFLALLNAPFSKCRLSNASLNERQPRTGILYGHSYLVLSEIAYDAREDGLAPHRDCHVADWLVELGQERSGRWRGGRAVAHDRRAAVRGRDEHRRQRLACR